MIYSYEVKAINFSYNNIENTHTWYSHEIFYHDSYDIHHSNF